MDDMDHTVHSSPTTASSGDISSLICLPCSPNDDLKSPREELILPLESPYEELILHSQNSYFCQICFEQQPAVHGFTLPSCGHVFCTDCLLRYLKVQVTDGIITPACFHPVMKKDKGKKSPLRTDDMLTVDIDDCHHDVMNTTTAPLSQDSIDNMDGLEKTTTKIQPHGTSYLDPSHSHHHDHQTILPSDRPLLAEQFQDAAVSETDREGVSDGVQEDLSEDRDSRSGSTTDIANSVHVCGCPIEANDIRTILAADTTLLAKFEFFTFIKGNKHARECPFCQHLQIGSPVNPTITCDNCHLTYCYEHANAHPNMTCEVYEQSKAGETAQNRTLIDLISKPCPGCNVHVEKSGGCNHMKCSNCGKAFCWCVLLFLCLLYLHSFLILLLLFIYIYALKSSIYLLQCSTM